MLTTGRIDRAEHCLVVADDRKPRVWIWVSGSGPYLVAHDLLATLARVDGSSLLSRLIGAEVAVEADADQNVTRLTFGPFDDRADVVELRRPLAAVAADPIDDTIRDMLAVLDGLRTKVAAGDVSALACVFVRRDGSTQTAWATKRGMAALAMAGAVHRFSVELATATVDVDGEIPGGGSIG